MPSPVAKIIRLLSLIAYLTLSKAQAANDSTTITGARSSDLNSKNYIIAAVATAPGIAFTVVFMMASLCRRPFGNKFVLRTPALVLGISPPFEDASSLGIKLRATPPDVVGEDNV